MAVSPVSFYNMTGSFVHTMCLRQELSSVGALQLVSYEFRCDTVKETLTIKTSKHKRKLRLLLEVDKRLSSVALV